MGHFPSLFVCLPEGNLKRPPPWRAAHLRRLGFLRAGGSILRLAIPQIAQEGNGVFSWEVDSELGVLAAKRPTAWGGKNGSGFLNHMKYPSSVWKDP